MSVWEFWTFPSLQCFEIPYLQQEAPGEQTHTLPCVPSLILRRALWFQRAQVGFPH